MRDESRRLFRQRPHPVRIIVARARIDGGVALDLCAPAKVRVDFGQPVEIVFPYSLIEASPERESYMLRLSSHIGGNAMPHQQQNWGDRWGWPEALDGFLQQRYNLDRGRHILEFTVEAAYRVRPWGHPEATLPQSKFLEGCLEVLIS